MTARFAKLCEVCRADARKRRRAAQTEWDRTKRKREQEAPRPERARDSAFDWRLRQDRKGVALKAVDKIEGETFPRLPAAPLAAKVATLVHREDHAARVFDPLHRTGRSESKEAVCGRLGIPPRTFTSWCSGERQQADFDTVDKVLQRAGWLWWEVYDESTVRSPFFMVEVRQRRAGRPVLETMRRVPYGDAGPDLAALALVERTFTGEGVEVAEQLTLSGTNTLGPPPGARTIEEYEAAMAERRAA